ncbi:MAG: hypothetical protein HZB66_02695 [Candidatus Aenigmarchaeota archaeon]|nr:hypothetical protein [Candidatus Aenigmarchaeota archaeon]
MSFVIPEMTPEELERVLKHLPEPSYAEVILVGDFDYSSISRQAQEVQGVELQHSHSCPLVFGLKGASKETLLDIYRTSNESRKVKFTRETRRIDLHKVGWYLDSGDVHVELTPTAVKVSYRDQEPDYISQMLQELTGTIVRHVEFNKGFF